MQHAFNSTKETHPMIRLSTLAMAIMVPWVAGCDALEQLDNISVPITTTVTVPGATPVDILLGAFPTPAGLDGFDFSQSSVFENSKYGPDDVDSIKLESLVFEVVSPLNQDLSFLESVVFFIETDDLPRIELARSDSFPEGATLVVFQPTNADLKRYVLGTQATVTTEAPNAERPPEETTIEVRAVFDADIRVF